ncbi:hypothetical protein GCM10025773_36580 [Microbacterium jejuense]
MARVPNATPAMTRFAARFAQYSLLLLGIGVGLAFLGANIQPLLAVVIVLAIVGVLVLRGVADNFAASVLIATRRPIVIGEQITVEGPDGELLSGTVSELNSRSVVLLTADGRTLHVPNAKLLGDTLVNDSRHGALRSEVQVRVERAGASIDDVVKTLVDAATAVDGVHEIPVVAVVVTGVSPERIVASVQFWHQPADGVTVTSDVVRALAAALAERHGAAVVSSDVPAAPLTPADPV